MECKRKRLGKRDAKRTQSSRPKKRKAWNKGQVNQSSDQSTSAAKLNKNDYPKSNFPGYRLFDLELLSTIINNITCCKLCGKDVFLEEVCTVGLGGDYRLCCEGCGFIQNFSNCKMVGPKKTMYDLNQRSVLASRLVGNGLSELRVFCGVMDLPPPVNPTAFRKLQTKVLRAATAEAENSMFTAVNEEIEQQGGDGQQRKEEQQGEINHQEGDEQAEEERQGEEDHQEGDQQAEEEQQGEEDHQEGDGQSEEERQGEDKQDREQEEQEGDEHCAIRTLQVTGDGTWQKRGFKSLNGAVSIIGTETKKVLDHAVLTSYCQMCTRWQEKNGLPKGQQWEDWYSTHRLICKRNYSGSASMMESAGMIRIFERSEEKYNVQYTHYIGDGDSKTYYNIVKAQPYGEKVVIEKLECIGHVGKRFGHHMRKLKIDMKKKKLSDGKGLFGKGRLTEKRITMMQTYYTGAIRNNPNSLSGMIRAIWAIWYHSGSTDDHPQHQFCPAGKNSWCKYQCAKATKQLKNFQHSAALPTAVMNAIRPIFIKMTSVSLLKRCLGGQTQNSNESFNSVLWKISPKNIFVGLDTLKLAASLATVLFNDGMCGILKILMELDATPGLPAISAAKKKDNTRLAKAEKQKSEDMKKKRIIYRKLRIDLQENYVDQEGHTYEAGAF